MVSEEAFLDALAMHAPDNAGAIDTQVFVASYRFVAPTLESFDRAAVESLLDHFASSHGFLVRARAHSLAFRSTLFNEAGPIEGMSVEIRFVNRCRSRWICNRWWRRLSRVSKPSPVSMGRSGGSRGRKGRPTTCGLCANCQRAIVSNSG